MRTTIDLPDELLRRARAKAAAEGRTLTSLIADGLAAQVYAAPPRRRYENLPVSKQTGGLHPRIDPTSNKSLLDAADGFLDDDDPS